MVAKGKTAVSLTYKPTTKPQNHENHNRNQISNPSSRNQQTCIKSGTLQKRGPVKVYDKK